MAGVPSAPGISHSGFGSPPASISKTETEQPEFSAIRRAAVAPADP